MLRGAVRWVVISLQLFCCAFIGWSTADESEAFEHGDSGLTDEDFANFEDTLSGLGDDFDPSHILTFAVQAGEVTCFLEDIMEEDLADADELEGMEAQGFGGTEVRAHTTLSGALFISGGSNRDINVQVSAKESAAYCL